MNKYRMNIHINKKVFANGFTRHLNKRSVCPNMSHW